MYCTSILELFEVLNLYLYCIVFNFLIFTVIFSHILPVLLNKCLLIDLEPLLFLICPKQIESCY